MRFSRLNALMVINKELNLNLKIGAVKQYSDNLAAQNVDVEAFAESLKMNF